MSSHESDRPVKFRHAPLDVARTVALFGIIVLNYHGYLNFHSGNAPTSPSMFERWWHPFEGVLANPFPVGFVMVAGMGVAMMVADANNEARILSEVRWRLARRGMFLFTLGYIIEWVWPGTILPYYGAFFVVAGVIAPWSRTRLIALAITASVVAAGVSWWRLEQSFRGNLTGWLSPSAPDSPRNLLIRLFIDYTHPIFPWLSFFIFGILLGRSYDRIATFAGKLSAICVGLVGFCYSLNSIVDSQTYGDARNGVVEALRWRQLASTQPFDRGLLYVGAAIGVVGATFVFIWRLCERFENSLVVRVSQTTGQMTLTIYLAHIFVYNLVVNQLGLIKPSGLDTAMAMSVAVYIVAIVWANWWQPKFGRGPAERLYRNFGG